MARFIATYDLDDAFSPHGAFFDAALDAGWEAWASTGDMWNRLPNTTLLGTFTNQDAAVASFKAIKPVAEAKLGHTITVEKWFLAQYSTATVSSDEKQPKE